MSEREEGYGGMVAGRARRSRGSGSRARRHRDGVASRRRLRISRSPLYRRRRRGALLVLFFLLVLTTLPILLVTNGPLRQTASAPSVSRVEPPLISTAPLAVGDGETEYKTPESNALSLTIPSLGLYGNTVRNDDSPAALDAGAIKLPSTGFPWQQNANPYISGHRIGYKDTESYYQFLDLPKMKKGDEVILEDDIGQKYVYNVTKVFAVEPTDVWVTEPIPGKDMVTLQTCTESVEDWTTIGPELMYSSPDTGRLIVRAERV